MKGKTIKAGTNGETGVLVQKSHIKGSFSYKVNGEQINSTNVVGTIYSYGMRFMLLMNANDSYSGVWIEVRDDFSEGRHDVVNRQPYLLFQSNELHQEWIATKGFLDFKRGTSGADTTCGGTFELAHDNEGYAKITEGTFKVGYTLDVT